MTDPSRAAYIHAAGVRRKAETTKVPELYEQAAAEFDAIGFGLAAEQCRKRAALYRALAIQGAADEYDFETSRSANND